MAGTGIHKKNAFVLATIISLPIWVLLALDVSLWDSPYHFLPGIVYVPGFVIRLLFQPTWEGMHNYRLWEILVVSCFFCYFLILLVIFLVRRIASRKSRHWASSGSTQ